MPEAGYTGDGKQASWAGFSTQEMLKLMHHPVVVSHLVRKAFETINLANMDRGDAFDMVLQNRPDTVRPRAYIMPNSKGIRLELKHGWLLKAALAMAGR